MTKKALPIIQVPEPLPVLYNRWALELLGGAIPREELATCDNCAMCGSDVVMQPNHTSTFKPNVKCCSYQPALPNYLLGLILSDEDPGGTAGRNTVRDRLASSNAATPLGVEPPASFSILYNKVYKFAFGTGLALRCPHYLEKAGGTCGIWKYRNGVCTTWFCKHGRGALGQSFWLELRDLFRTLEHQLSMWTALELGLDQRVLLGLLPPREPWFSEDKLAIKAGLELSTGYSVERARVTWGEWFDRQDEYYRSCGDLVSRLSFSDVLALAGVEAKCRAESTSKAYEALIDSGTLPTALKLESLTAHRGDGATVKITTYSYDDPITLSHRLFQSLQRFDGRPVAIVRDEIERLDGLRIEDTLLRSLVDYNVLKALG